jgi:protocatechuate 3,4-dioxygenase beta subunit
VVALEGVAGGTTPNLSGPYYKPDAPTRDGGLLFDGEPPNGGTPLVVRGTVTHVETAAPLAGAELDVWQADGNGDYDVDGFQLRGIVPIGADGRYEFKTVLPEGYEIPAKGPTSQLLGLMGQSTWRPAHIHVRINVSGRPVFQTQFFIDGARFLETDPVDAVRDDLVIPIYDEPDGHGKALDFDIRINPDRPAGIAYDKSAHKS